MKLTVHGAGYVGLVTAACVADTGAEVLCIDIDSDKINLLSTGTSTIFEPGLEAVIRRNLSSGRLAFTTDIEAAVTFSDVQMIAVGTPQDVGGSADLQAVLDVAAVIASHMCGYKLVVSKSTVPVGTVDAITEAINAGLSARGVEFEFDVVSNPEFLKEGAALSDFMRPDRIIIGTDSPRAEQLLRSLYAPFSRSHSRFLVMDARSAELTKYAANAMLATRISFMNELAGIAEKVGADIEKVRYGIGSDTRIGYEFIYAGCGFGGSCFPKDVRALVQMAEQEGCGADILQAVERVNVEQKNILYSRLKEHFGDALRGLTVALWGLAFKPNTDDMREAPSRAFLEACWSAGVTVRAYDPVAAGEALRLYGDRCDFRLFATAEEAAEGADALVIATEWAEFRNPDFQALLELLRQAVVIDGRNLFEPEQMLAKGIDYYSVGRAKPL
jgi:UDPglucose 6-dehydrogenase